MTSAQQLKILVADDSEIVRNSIASMLLKYDIHATFAKSGQQAIRLNEAEHFDLAILDIQMPGLSGIHAAIKMQNHPHIPKLVFLTGSLEVVHEKLINNLNAYKTLTKPIEFADIEEILDSLVNLDAQNHITEKTQLTELEHPEHEIFCYEDGLQRFGNNDVLFHQQLIKFTNVLETKLSYFFEHAVIEIEQGSTNSFANLQYFVHGVKGDAAFIGAYYLESIAKTANDALKVKSFTRKELDTLLSAAKLTLDEIQKHIKH